MYYPLPNVTFDELCSGEYNINLIDTARECNGILKYLDPKKNARDFLGQGTFKTCHSADFSPGPHPDILDPMQILKKVLVQEIYRVTKVVLTQQLELLLLM